MKRWIGALGAAALLLPVAALAHGKEDHSSHAPKDAPAKAAAAATTLEGEVLDSACYFSHGGKGAGHKKCAQDCLLNKGVAPTFLTKDGSIYLLTAEHGKEKGLKAALEKPGEPVKLTGTVKEEGGMKVLLVAEPASAPATK